jgi:hypothetical protein
MVVCAAGATTNPIAKVVEMVSALQQKVLKSGDEAQKMYTEFAEMCEDRSRELHNEIKTGKAQVQELTSTIEKATADITVLEEQIGDFASSISEDEADLKKATAIRKKENADFKAEEKELLATINTIERATQIVEREMNGGASLAQVAHIQSVTQALAAMVDAQAVSSGDGAKLMALMQSSSDSEEDSDEMGAPSAANYQGQSGGIVDALEGLLSRQSRSLRMYAKQRPPPRMHMPCRSNLSMTRSSFPTRRWLRPRRAWLQPVRPAPPLQEIWMSPRKISQRTSRT